MAKGLLTTNVGSFPKPEWLMRARTKFQKGEISDADLRALEKKATLEIIRLQEELGLDILVHGEMERGDMTTYFAEKLEGMGVSGLIRSYGNRYYRKPVVQGKLRRNGAMTVDAYLEAQALTKLPVKGMLTGPYTMTDWSFNDYYPNRRDLILAFAEVLHEEVKDLEQAGAEYIQIDEPALSTRPDEIDLAIEALGIVTKGIKAKTLTHICYGHFETIYPKLLDLPVDQLDLEVTNGDFALLDLLKTHPFHKEIGLGVVDVHTHRIESVSEIKKGIEKALEFIPAEQIFVDPDCGLKTRTMDESIAKLKNMVTAVQEVKTERGIQ